MPGAISFLFPPFSFREAPPRHFLPEGLWFGQDHTWSTRQVPCCLNHLAGSTFMPAPLLPPPPPSCSLAGVALHSQHCQKKMKCPCQHGNFGSPTASRGAVFLSNPPLGFQKSLCHVLPSGSDYAEISGETLFCNFLPLRSSTTFLLC